MLLPFVFLRLFYYAAPDMRTIRWGRIQSRNPEQEFGAGIWSRNLEQELGAGIWSRNSEQEFGAGTQSRNLEQEWGVPGGSGAGPEL